MVSSPAYLAESGTATESEVALAKGWIKTIMPDEAGKPSSQAWLDGWIGTGLPVSFYYYDQAFSADGKAWKFQRENVQREADVEGPGGRESPCTPGASRILRTRLEPLPARGRESGWRLPAVEPVRGAQIWENVNASGHGLERQRILRLLLPKCACCSATTDLEFDCIRPVGNLHARREQSVRMSFYRRQLSAGNLQVLCGRCNSTKSDRRNLSSTSIRVGEQVQ